MCDVLDGIEALRVRTPQKNVHQYCSAIYANKRMYKMTKISTYLAENSRGIFRFAGGVHL